ncbi:MAG: bacillithiol system redox-active protein YtxJ [Chitinophagales bacterium]|jgi:bacillithiol system protein YtxJ|nr:bacillithiol system redox-active protein YtxJ [Chitinophagales bacterium]
MNLISSIEALEQKLLDSHERPVLFFKHSTICPVSTYAHKEIINHLEALETEMDVVKIEVIEARPVSNALAERTQVTHQSPQAILVRNGLSIYDESHYQIQAKIILAQLKESI